jgi:SAM-dependent methyltransferase
MNRPDEVVEAEVNTILRLLAKHSITGRKLLELACGACAHGIRLAGQGFQVTGIDRSIAMLDEAQRRAKLAGAGLQTIEGDVIQFNLDATDFDAAIFMFETFPVITDYDDIVSHFRSVRRHLKRGGLYIVDVDVRKRGVGIHTGEWGRRTETLPNGYVETWCEDFPGDWVQGTSHLVLHCRICLDGQMYETVDDWRLRVYSPWELSLLARTLEGWELDGFYSWQDLDADITNEAHYFTVFVAS